MSKALGELYAENRVPLESMLRVGQIPHDRIYRLVAVRTTLGGELRFECTWDEYVPRERLDGHRVLRYNVIAGHISSLKPTVEIDAIRVSGGEWQEV